MSQAMSKIKQERKSENELRRTGVELAGVCVHTGRHLLLQVSTVPQKRDEGGFPVCTVHVPGSLKATSHSAFKTVEIRCKVF